MNRKLRWKSVVLLVVVLATSAVAWFPPVAGYLGLSGPRMLTEQRLMLGLDLQGGVQFELRVNADEALTTDPTLTRAEVVEQAREAVDRRIDALGVLEPLIAIQGDQRDEILVQLPGFTDVTRARSIIGQTARLDWRLMEGDAPSATAAVSGRDIRRAWVTRDDLGLPAVGFSLTADGARRFADLTASNIGRQVAIVLDDEVQSAPVIEGAITGGEGVIRGGFSTEEASDLALLLRSGALPVSLTFLGGEYVGPTLGSMAVDAGVAASTGGLLLIALFMVAYYRRAGLNAVVSIAANLGILFGLMALMGRAMTLPGIAGLILTIGIGVDSNVLIVERIREELRKGLPIRRAVAAGFDRVFLTLLDTHVASLIAAAFLFQFGSGPIRGFATTLSLGLLANLFTAVVVSRTMFEITLARGRRLTLGRAQSATPAPRRSFAPMSYRRIALFAAAGVVALSVAATTVRGIPLGLDFTGGTAVVAAFTAPVDEDDVRDAIPGETVVQRFGQNPERTLQIRVPGTSSGTGGGDLEADVRTITTALGASDLPDAEVIGSRTVGPAIGKNLQQKGAYALLASLAGISAYLALRFRPSFATGAAVAVAHDLTVTVAALSVFGYDLDLNVVAALLTVAGYSVNDTIVIFDRVRERARAVARGAFAPAVDAAVSDMLGRTLITSGTTFVAVLALYLFGGTALEGFAFTMLVGIIVGTWSSVFVAAPVAGLVMRRRPANRVARAAATVN